jgi:hypothetical protein
MCGHRCCRAGRYGRERGRAPRRRAARRRRDTTGSVATGAAGLGTPAAWPWWMALTYWLRLAASGPSLAQASRLRAGMVLGRRRRTERWTSSATERGSLAVRPRTRASSSGWMRGRAVERRSTTGTRRRPPLPAWGGRCGIAGRWIARHPGHHDRARERSEQAEPRERSERFLDGSAPAGARTAKNPARSRPDAQSGGLKRRVNMGRGGVMKEGAREDGGAGNPRLWRRATAAARRPWSGRPWAPSLDPTETGGGRRGELGSGGRR